MKKATPSEKNKTKTIDSIAGAGSGTLLITLAQNIPDSQPIKKFLIIMAPSISIIFISLVTFARNEINERYEYKKLKKLYVNAKENLLNSINNEVTSEQHKEKLKSQFEELESLWIDTNIKRFGNFKIT